MPPQPPREFRAVGVRTSSRLGMKSSADRTDAARNQPSDESRASAARELPANTRKLCPYNYGLWSFYEVVAEQRPRQNTSTAKSKRQVGGLGKRAAPDNDSDVDPEANGNQG